MTSSLDADGALAAEVFGTAPPAPPVPEPPAAPEPDQQPESGQAEQLPEFDPRFRKPFEGLLYLGRLSDEVIIWGHQFQLLTPSTAERLEMGLLIHEFEGTLAYDFAYATALVAAYLVEVDGTPLPQPITNDAKDTALLSRWNWVKNTLRRPVIERLFQQCFLLDDTVRKVLDAMGKA